MTAHDKRARMKQTTIDPRFTRTRQSILALALGTIFCGLASASAASLTTLHSFDGADGTTPEATLVAGGEGFLYGTTFGTTNSGGTIFRISLDGTFSTVATLDPGENIRAELVRASDGSLY